MSGKVSAELTKGARMSRKVKTAFYKTTLNTCPSFSNEVKNLAKDTGIKYSDLCTQACPYRLARLGTSLRMRGKRTTKGESNQVFINEIEWKLPQKNRIQTASRPRLSGKVSTERLTEGVSVSRNGRIKICMSKNKKYRNGFYKKAVPGHG